jgi:hypothetical protein
MNLDNDPRGLEGIYYAGERRHARIERRPNYTLRRLGAAALAVLAVVGAVKVGSAIADKGNGIECTGETDHEIEPGETVWGLAQDIPGAAHLDMRAVVDEVADMNPGLVIGHVDAGQHLTLPAACEQ